MGVADFTSKEIEKIVASVVPPKMMEQVTDKSGYAMIADAAKNVLTPEKATGKNDEFPGPGSFANKIAGQNKGNNTGRA